MKSEPNILIRLEESTKLRDVVLKQRLVYIKNNLIRLIEQDEHTKSLTVAIMALRDLKNDEIKSAIMRLKVDMDKIRMTNPELNDFIQNYPFATKRKLLPFDECFEILEERKNAQWRIEIRGEEWYSGDIWHVMIKGPMHDLEAEAKVSWPLTLLDAIQIAVDNLHESSNGRSALYFHYRTKEMELETKENEGNQQ